MIPYIATFLASCMFAFFAQKSKTKNMFIFFSSVAIILPCLLAALRADTIGTDVTVYVKPLYNIAKDSSSFADYYSASWYVDGYYRPVAQQEFGFTFLVFSVAKIFGDFAYVLFAIHLFIIVPMYLGLSYFRKQYPVWLSLMIFYLTFYNMSLNAMRQCIAIAILFFGLKYIVEHKYFVYILIMFIAMLFHMTAVGGVLILFIYKYLEGEKGTENIRIGSLLVPHSNFKLFVIVIISIFIVFGLQLLVKILSVIPIVNLYLRYLDGEWSFLGNQFLLSMAFALLVWFSRKQMIKKNDFSYFLIAIFMLHVATTQLGSVTAYATRISYMFSVYNILLYSAIVMHSSFKTNRKLYGIVVFSILLFCWYYDVVVRGINETYPYVVNL